MRVWTFYDFVTGSGRNAIREWVNGQAKGVSKPLKARLNALIAELELVDGPFDRQHGVGQLRGKPCKGLYEVILKVSKIQFRVLGCYGPRDQGEFTLLVGATERDGSFDPENACETAQQRRGLIATDRRYVSEHRFD